MYMAVFITSGSKEEAEKISKGLLEDKLAACVNIIKGVESYFWWEGKIDRAEEFLLVVKTRDSLMAELIAKVKSLHSYSVPEIIGMPINEGNKEYLEWIDGSTR